MLIISIKIIKSNRKILETYKYKYMESKLYRKIEKNIPKYRQEYITKKIKRQNLTQI